MTSFDDVCIETDHYNGRIVHVERYKGTVDQFRSTLGYSLENWKNENVKGVWIRVPTSMSAFVPAAMEEHQFEYHSIATDEKANKVLILTRWLLDSTSRLPRGPTYQVGVGCIVWHPHDVANDSPLPVAQRRILVVKEKVGPAKAHDLWKIPTGLVDPREDIHQAAIRELKEETGLNGEFVYTTAIKQSHHANVSDLFFVCEVKLIIDDDDDLKAPWTACPIEIEAIQWMRIAEFAGQPRWQFSPLFMHLNRLMVEDQVVRQNPWTCRTFPARVDVKTKEPIGNETQALYCSGASF